MWGVKDKINLTTKSYLTTGMTRLWWKVVYLHNLEHYDVSGASGFKCIDLQKIRVPWQIHTWNHRERKMWIINLFQVLLNVIQYQTRCQERASQSLNLHTMKIILDFAWVLSSPDHMRKSTTITAHPACNPTHYGTISQLPTQQNWWSHERPQGCCTKQG